jgi:hypothetical protein
VFNPLLGDARLKDREDIYIIIPSGIEESSRLQEILDDKLTDIGGGEFDVDSLLRISDPQKRMRELCSLLDIIVLTPVNSIV